MVVKKVSNPQQSSLPSKWISRVLEKYNRFVYPRLSESDQFFKA